MSFYGVYIRSPRYMVSMTNVFGSKSKNSNSFLSDFITIVRLKLLTAQIFKLTEIICNYLPTI